MTGCFVVFSTAKRSQPLAGGRRRRTTGKRSTKHVASRRDARWRGAGIPPECETFRDIEPVVRLRRPPANGFDPFGIVRFSAPRFITCTK